MKKLFLLILAFCICLSLTACAATDPNNLFETTEKPDGTTVLGTDETQPEPEDVILYQGTYQYGNMQNSMPEYMLLGNEVLFTPSRSHGPYYVLGYDLRTGEVQYFCKDATCAHKDCASALFHNLEVYKGKLYGIRLDSSRNNYELVAVNGDTVEVIIDGVTSFNHHEDKLYLHTLDSSLMVLEEGEKEPKMVLEEYTGDMDIFFGNYLYAIKWGTGIIRIDLTAETPQEEVLVENALGITDGQHIYYTDETSYQLYRCNIDGSDPQLIEEREVNNGSMNFDEEYFYYRLYTDWHMEGTPDCYDIYRFPKDDPTQIEKIATLPVPVHQIFTVPGTGKIFVTAERLEGEENRSVYILDCDGGNMKKLEIPE